MCSNRTTKFGFSALAAVLVTLNFGISFGQVTGPAQMQFSQGFEFLKKGDFAGAASSFEKGLAVDPKNALAHYYYAEALRGLGKKGEALNEYKSSLKLDPDSKVADKAADAIVSLRGAKSTGGSSPKVSDRVTGTWQIWRVESEDATEGRLEGTMDFTPTAGGRYECKFTLTHASEVCTATVVNDQVNIRSQLAEPTAQVYYPDNFYLKIVEPGKMTGLLLSNVTYRVLFLKEGSGQEWTLKP